jgi:hypothetical protein
MYRTEQVILSQCPPVLDFGLDKPKPHDDINHRKTNVVSVKLVLSAKNSPPMIPSTYTMSTILYMPLSVCLNTKGTLPPNKIATTSSSEYARALIQHSLYLS